MNVELKKAIGDFVEHTCGIDFVNFTAHPLHGGCINHCYHLVGEHEQFFIKLNHADRLPHMQAEYIGLTQLQATHTIRVPQPIATGAIAGHAALLLEYLPLTESATAQDWATMGTHLAHLHNTSIEELNPKLSRTHQLPARFGVRINTNTLGNQTGFLGEKNNWATFFVTHRLQFQFNQAQRIHHTVFPQTTAVLETATALLQHAPPPALVHGDLWAGNAHFALLDGEITPIIFDPAPYVADSETDVAMTELFSGFTQDFYTAYGRVRPLAKGYAQRRTIYNLFHILNHYNLFGSAYRQQATAMMEEIILYGR